MAVYDCFLFLNELDLLELRLETLWDVVDHFVLVESTRTFSNLTKQPLFDRKKRLFAKYLSKIRHVVVTSGPWPKKSGSALSKPERRKINNFQRENMFKGLKDAQPDDLVMISDCDEIPRPEAVLAANRRVSDAEKYLCLHMDMYVYLLNGFRGSEWPGTVVTRNKYIPREKNGISKVFLQRKKPMPCLHKAGWHFCYQGDIRAIQTKLSSYCHIECEKFRNEKVLRSAIKTGKYLFGTGNITYVPFDSSFPPYALSNPKYLKMVSKTTHSDRRARGLSLVRMVPLSEIKTVLYIGARSPEFSLNTELAKKQIDILEVWPENVEKMKEVAKSNRSIHSVILGSAMDFHPDQKWDLVVWWHGPEHVAKEDLPKVIENLQGLTGKYLALGCPFGQYEQGAKYGNPYEEHKSALGPEDFTALGFKVETLGQRNVMGSHLSAVWKVLDQKVDTCG